MNKVLIFITSLFTLTAGAYAQQTSIGITVGTGSGWMSNTGRDLDYKQSYNIGVTMIYSSATHWGFGADIKYSREGYKYNFQNPFLYGDNKMDTRVNSDFIRVPLRVIYFFNNNEYKVRPTISLGPSLGFLTGGNIRVEDEDDNLYLKTDVSDQYNSFDLGLQGTAGLSFKLAETLWLSTDVAYYQGLLKQNLSGDSNMMNRNLVLNLSLRIGI